MKKFEFKQAALLGKRGLAATVDSEGKKVVPPHGGHGKIYSVGVHEVPEAHQEDATFKHFLKHKLVVPFVPKEQKELEPAKSDIAKVSQAAAAQQLQPEAEIGGDEPAEEAKGGKGKGKKEK